MSSENNKIQEIIKESLENIRSIIDKARQTPTLRGQFTGIQGERDAKAVSFSSEFSSEKVQKFSKNDPYTKVANISLR